LTDTDQERQKPPWVTPRIVAAPKIRQIYWCEFWQDARLPDTDNDRTGE
jgi:mRNA interferase MazF